MRRYLSQADAELQFPGSTAVPASQHVNGLVDDDPEYFWIDENNCLHSFVGASWCGSSALWDGKNWTSMIDDGEGGDIFCIIPLYPGSPIPC